MLEFSLDNELHFPVDRMWELLLDPEFNRGIYLQGLGFDEFDVVSQVEKSGETTRVLRVVPRVNLPKPIVKLLGESFAYEEHVTYRAAEGFWRWDLNIPAAGDRVKIGGNIELRPKGQNCIRHTTFEIEAKVFGIGGLIEKSAKKEVMGSYDKSAAWINAQA